MKGGRFPPVTFVNRMTDVEFRAVVERQRQDMLALADRVDAGGDIGAVERTLIAAILRAWANLPKKQKRPRGKPPVLDPGTVAFLFGQLVKRDGLTQETAYGQLADEYGVTEEAVRKSIKPHKQSILDWYDELLVDN